MCLLPVVKPQNSTEGDIPIFYNSRHIIFVFISQEGVIVIVKNGIRSDNNLLHW